MIALDTNVISELARQVPDPGVLSWLDSLEASNVVTTAVTAAELRYFVARLPDGHRKRELAAVIRGILTEDFYGRVLPFDERASVRYASIVTGPDRTGRPTPRCSRVTKMATSSLRRRMVYGFSPRRNAQNGQLPPDGTTMLLTRS
jgi:hypothetical protein